jgi:hypothetical protein
MDHKMKTVGRELQTSLLVRDIAPALQVFCLQFAAHDENAPHHLLIRRL